MITNQIISDYSKLCHSVTDLIELSGYRIDHVCSRLGLTRIGFYKKRKSGSFKPDELQKLFTIIDNGTLEDKLLCKILEKADATKELLSDSETKKLFSKK